MSRGYSCIASVRSQLCAGTASVNQASDSSTVRSFATASTSTNSHRSRIRAIVHSCTGTLTRSSPLSSQVRWPRRSATLAPCAGRRLRGRPGAARAAHRAAARQRSIRLPPRAHWHRARAALRARQPQRRTATMPHRIYYSDKYYDANDYEYRCAPPPRRARPRRALHRGLTIGLFCGAGMSSCRRT